MGELVRDGERILVIGEQLVESDLEPTERPPGSGWVRRFADLLVAHAPAIRVQVIDRTEPSAEVHQLWERLIDDVVALRPDRLIVTVGLSDAYQGINRKEPAQRLERFAAIYRRLLAETRRRLPTCRFVLMQPLVATSCRSPYRHSAAILEGIVPYQAAVAEIAREAGAEHLPVHDLVQAWKRRYGNDCFGPDHIHPDLQGHLLIAEALSRTIAPRPERLTRAPLSCPSEWEPESRPTWVLTGDSITDAGRRDRHRLLGRGYARLVEHLLRIRRPERPVRMVNTGVGGDTIVDLHARWDEDALRHRPELVSVKIGINDCNRHLCNPDVDLSPARFAKVYAECLERTRAALPRTRLVLVTPFYLSRDDLAESYPAKVLAALQGFILAVEDLGRRFDAHVVRPQPLFQEHLALRHNREFGREQVHPNDLGALVLAEAVYAAIADL